MLLPVSEYSECEENQLEPCGLLVLLSIIRNLRGDERGREEW